MALAAFGPQRSKTKAKRGIVRAVESVAKSLGNTKAVCRRCYIHPAILDGYMHGVTLQTLRSRAETGIEWISMGSLTHSAPALDLSLAMEPLP